MQFTHLQIIYTCIFFHIYDIALMHYSLCDVISHRISIQLKSATPLIWKRTQCQPSDLYSAGLRCSGREDFSVACSSNKMFLFNT